MLLASRPQRQLLLPAQAALHPAHVDTADPEQLRAAVRDLQQQVNHLQAENARLRGESPPRPPTPPQPTAKSPQSMPYPSSSAARPGSSNGAAWAEATQLSVDETSDTEAEPRYYTVSELHHAVKWPKPGGRFWEQPPRNKSVQLPDDSPPGRAIVQRAPSPMTVVHVTAEMAPCAKVGGLADVVQGLAKASLERGHNVSVRIAHANVTPHADFLPSSSFMHLLPCGTLQHN